MKKNQILRLKKSPGMDRGTAVCRQRSDNTIVLVLFHDMGAPTSDSRSHKDRSVLRNWDTQDEISHTAREIDIWMDRFVTEHDRLDLIKPPQPVTNSQSARNCFVSGASCSDRICGNAWANQGSMKGVKSKCLRWSSAPVVASRTTMSRAVTTSRSISSRRMS